MIKHSYQKNGVLSFADYSECYTYRYSLKRIWQNNAPRVVFVLLNPSTATEINNDPTVARCEKRARQLGYGSFCVTNIFALRETNPKKMKSAQNPVGEENDMAISSACNWGDEVIAAWGTNGQHFNRDKTIKELLRLSKKPIFHLGLSKAGYPRHPLYIGYKQKPILWKI